MHQSIQAWHGHEWVKALSSDSCFWLQDVSFNSVEINNCIVVKETPLAGLSIWSKNWLRAERSRYENYGKWKENSSKWIMVRQKPQTIVEILTKQCLNKSRKKWVLPKSYFNRQWAYSPSVKQMDTPWSLYTINGALLGLEKFIHTRSASESVVWYLYICFQ